MTSPRGTSSSQRKKSRGRAVESAKTEVEGVRGRSHQPITLTITPPLDVIVMTLKRGCAKHVFYFHIHDHSKNKKRLKRCFMNSKTCIIHNIHIIKRQRGEYCNCICIIQRVQSSDWHSLIDDVTTILKVHLFI